MKENLYYGKHSRFDAPNSDENLSDNKKHVMSMDGIIELFHIELDNWYDTTKRDFQKLSDGVKDLKRAYAKMTTTFSKNLANEEEQYKKELNMMLSLTGKCNNHIEHLKELAGNMSLNPVERKARTNMIMSFRLQ